MRIKLGFLFTLFAAILIMAGCVPPPDYDDVPFIRLEALNSTSLTMPGDSLVITIYFEDGDGDLGVNKEDDTTNLQFVNEFGCVLGSVKSGFDTSGMSNIDVVAANAFIVDPRIAGTCTRYYRLPYLTPKSKYKDISGQILITLTSLVVVNSPDTVIFDLYIEDRAGRRSNVIQTPPIIISK
ncbi:MAG: hypothetical protein IIA45_05745 [Bacteroidetes bacterium]|nr:hypothetical protein [Bacteroidota bacterium]